MAALTTNDRALPRESLRSATRHLDDAIAVLANAGDTGNTGVVSLHLDDAYMALRRALDELNGPPAS